MSNIVHLLWFVPEGTEDDEALLIGIYDTENAAKAAIARLADKPGFLEFPQGFQIHQREIGRDYWPEGFIREQ